MRLLSREREGERGGGLLNEERKWGEEEGIMERGPYRGHSQMQRSKGGGMQNEGRKVRRDKRGTRVAWAWEEGKERDREEMNASWLHRLECYCDCCLVLLSQISAFAPLLNSCLKYP